MPHILHSSHLFAGFPAFIPFTERLTVLKRQQSIHQTHKRGLSAAVASQGSPRPFALFQLYIRLFKYRNALPVPEIGKSQSTSLYHHFIPVLRISSDVKNSRTAAAPVSFNCTCSIVEISHNKREPVFLKDKFPSWQFFSS